MRIWRPRHGRGRRALDVTPMTSVGSSGTRDTLTRYLERSSHMRLSRLSALGKVCGSPTFSRPNPQDTNLRSMFHTKLEEDSLSLAMWDPRPDLNGDLPSLAGLKLVVHLLPGRLFLCGRGECGDRCSSFGDPPYWVFCRSRFDGLSCARQEKGRWSWLATGV